MDLAEEIRKQTDPEILFGKLIKRHEINSLITDIEFSISHFEEMRRVGNGDSFTDLCIDRLEKQLKFLKA